MNTGNRCCGPTVIALLVWRSLLWLLILSVVIGGVLALFLAIGRVSSNKYIQFPIWLFTYIFRGTPLCRCSCFISGMYTLIVKGTEFLNAFFRSGLNCSVLALTLLTPALTLPRFLLGRSVRFRMGKLKPPEPMASRLLKCIVALFCLLRCVLRYRHTATK